MQIKTAAQKLKQKEHSNNLDNTRGALRTIISLRPIFVISNMLKAANNETTII